MESAVSRIKKSIKLAKKRQFELDGLLPYQKVQRLVKAALQDCGWLDDSYRYYNEQFLAYRRMKWYNQLSHKRLSLDDMTRIEKFIKKRLSKNGIEIIQSEFEQIDGYRGPYHAFVVKIGL